MEEQPNDRWPQENGNPFKKIDWWILALLVFVFIVTFPLLARLYRFLIPIGALIFIVYFAYKFTQLGKVTGTVTNTAYPTISMVLTEIGLGFKKHFRLLALLSLGAIGLFVGSVLWYTNYAKKSDMENQFSKIALAIEKNKHETGKYPSTLIELIGSSPLRREWIKDGWGNPIQYTVGEASFKLSSSGKDGIFGNEDDVVLDTNK